MASVKVNRIVGILPALGKHDPSLEIVSVEAEEFADFSGIPYLFQRDDIGIKGKDKD